MSQAENSPAHEVTRLADLSPQQWRSGIAAWLGWLFDGLDMHLYTLVATPFVALLLASTSAIHRSAEMPPGFKRRSWSVGRWGVDFRPHWRPAGPQPRH